MNRTCPACSARLDQHTTSCPHCGANLTDGADSAVLAQLASATIHTIAIRARAQTPRKDLEAIVKGALEVMLLGAAK